MFLGVESNQPTEIAPFIHQPFTTIERLGRQVAQRGAAGGLCPVREHSSVGEEIGGGSYVTQTTWMEYTKIGDC